MRLLENQKSKEKKIFKFGFGQSQFKVPADVVEELKPMLIKINIYPCKAYPS